MDAAATLALPGILAAVLLGAMSPGPSFLLVARIAIAGSRRDGLAAALGMGLGAVLFGALALFGLHAILAQVAWLRRSLEVLGGLYLLWLAVTLWRGAGHPATMTAPAGGHSAGLVRSFALGLATQISNPKTAVVYGGIFAALLPADPPVWLLTSLPPAILLIEAGWYAVVAVAFSSGRPRAAYLSSKGWLDRAAGSVMGALGLRLIVQ
ncbi:MAG: LysE family transporter [Alphaproteobacteria bacterium]|nr:LysE family transporter [Alphaproteobacteria bacterium]